MRFSIRVEAITYYLLGLTRKAVADKFLILSMTSLVEFFLLSNSLPFLDGRYFASSALISANADHLHP